MTSTYAVPEEMKINYLERKLVEFEQCHSEIKEGNFDLAKTVGHQMKGNASTFGFPLLGNLAELIERAALDQDLEQVEVHLKDAERATRAFLKSAKIGAGPKK